MAFKDKNILGKLKKGYVKDHNRFMEENNPWNTKEAKKQIEKFAELSKKYKNEAKISEETEKFSWLDIEPKYHTLFKDSEKNKTDKKLYNQVPANVHYGLPSHVIGNFETANFFLCLANPNIDVVDSYKTFEHSDSSGKKRVNNIFEYYKTFNEVTKFDKSSYFENFDTEEKINSYIINEKESIIAQEMKQFLSSLDNPTEKKLEKIFNGGQYYYIEKYYNFLFTEKGGIAEFRKQIKNEILNKKPEEYEFIDKVIKADVCNLELFPFRSKTPSLDEGKYGNVILHEDTKTILFTSKIIVRRIIQFLIDENKNKPIFAFRMYDKWKSKISQVLKNVYGLEEDEIIVFLTYCESELFYGFPNTNGAISQKNLYRLPLDKYRIPKETFSNLQNSL
ncbi:hypothetical protein ETI10_00240 [Macrococcoides goetzii]|nr:hypothetical protein [Macrococcus goetzii]TDM41549.1 hypothetical protein ETI10_00240 [Macrococcus goetzii]